MILTFSRTDLLVILGHGSAPDGSSPRGCEQSLVIGCSRRFFDSFLYWSLGYWGHGSAPDGSSPRGCKQSLVIGCSLDIIFPSPVLTFDLCSQPVFGHCERLLIDVDRWRQVHDSAQDTLTLMSRKMLPL